MGKTSNIERTAINPFTLNGDEIGRGQVVSLNTTQLKSLVASGCVAESDEDNAEVPRRDIPATQGTIKPEVKAPVTASPNPTAGGPTPPAPAKV